MTAALEIRYRLKQYLAASHVVVATYAGVQTIPDKQLARCWRKNATPVYELPYFGGGPAMPPGATELVLTLTSGMTSVVKRESQVYVSQRRHRKLQRFSLLNGLASTTKHRSSSRVASRGDPIGKRGASMVRRKGALNEPHGKFPPGSAGELG